MTTQPIFCSDAGHVGANPPIGMVEAPDEATAKLAAWGYLCGACTDTWQAARQKDHHVRPRVVAPPTSHH